MSDNPRNISVLILILVLVPPVFCQAHHPNHDRPPDPASTAELNEGLMQNQGSGTSWMPAATPAYAFMKHTETWMLMMHFNVFGGYTYQSGKLGDDQVFSTNWLMFAAERKVAGVSKAGKGTLMFRGMISMEPLTVGGKGYPLIFQTGETFKGAELTNRQHPHDFAMEIAAAYRAPIVGKWFFSVYGAPVGDPALGPPAFMHRLSAIDNPEAPIGHHWQDSTHISAGVITIGVGREQWKVEGSIFTGRERNEQRWDIDRPKFDSWSTRVSYNPLKTLSVQASYGFLRSPEALQPLVDERRITASAIYNRPFGDNSYSATTFVWGRNIKNERGYSGFSTDSILLESTLSFKEKSSVFMRYERVEKSELFAGAHVHGQYADVYTVHRISFGGVQNLPLPGPLALGIGACFGIPVIPPGTEFVFGRQLYSATAYLRFRPKPRNAGQTK